MLLTCGRRRILQLEEEMVQEMCSDVLRVKPDLVITEKGVSDLAQHFLMKAGVSVIRRVRKTDNNRIARYHVFRCMDVLNRSIRSSTVSPGWPASGRREGTLSELLCAVLCTIVVHSDTHTDTCVQ